MSFYRDLDRRMQDPEFRHSYEEQSRRLEGAAAEPIPIRQRPIPDQLDHYAELLAPLVDRDRVKDREAMIAVGATLVGLGYIASKLRAQPLPSITDGVSDGEAYASATFDLTIEEVRGLKARAEEAEALKRAAYADRSDAIERADRADAALAELRTLLSETRQEWGVQHELLGTEYAPSVEAARHLCRERNAGLPHRPWRLVKRTVGEWKAADDDR